MKYTKENSKMISTRLSLEEYEKLLLIAPKGKVSEFIRARIFDVSTATPAQKERFDLAMSFTEDFIEDLMVKSRTVRPSEDNNQRRAKYLHDCVLHAEMSLPAGQSNVVKHRIYPGFQVESTGYNNEEVESKWVFNGTVRKILTKGDLGYDEFDGQYGNDQR